MATPRIHLEANRSPLGPVEAVVRAPPLRATDLTLPGAFAYCRALAARHAASFPLSPRLPRNLAPFFDAIFAFARAGSEIANGPAFGARRLAALAEHRDRLWRAYDGSADHPIFVALGHTIDLFELPIGAFEQMLEGLEANLRNQPFSTYAALDRHCRLVAVPMGELVLRLFDVRDAETLRAGDALAIAVCQTDYWEDVQADARRGRVYLPAEDLRHFGVDPAQLTQAASAAGRELLRFEALRTRALLEQARPLLRQVRGPLAFEMRVLYQATARRLRGLIGGSIRLEPLPLARARSSGWLAWARW